MAKEAARSRVWMIGVGLVVALFVVSAVVATSTGSDPSAIATPDDWLGWKLPNRSRTFELVERYDIQVPSDGLFVGAVGSPEQLYVLVQDYAEDDLSENDGLVYYVHALDPQGNVRWTRSFDGDVLAWPIGTGLMVYNREGYLDKTGVLHRLNPTSGQSVWNVDVTADPKLSADFDGRSYMTDGRKLTAVDLGTGEVLGSEFHEFVGDVNDLRYGGGIAVRDRTDVIVLDADLAEISRFPADGDGAVSYSGGHVLALDIKFPLRENTARLYDADGVEVANAVFATHVTELTAVSESTWVYTTGTLGEQRCGGIRASVADATVVQTWQQDSCVRQAVAQLDDGATYVMSLRDGDFDMGEFYDATTGEQVDIPPGSPTLGTNCFMTIPLGDYKTYLVFTSGEEKTVDASTLVLIDGGALLQYRNDDEQDFIAVGQSAS